MCGLSGAIGSNINKDKLTILMLYNDSRGGDSCGFYDGEITVQCTKAIKDGKGEFHDLLTVTHPDTKNNVVLTHARAASPGVVVNLENAHPFLIKNTIVGTHNGIIRNVKELCEEYGLECVNSDSKSLFMIFEQVDNNLADIAKILGKYVGAAALVWTDLRNNHTFLFRGESVRTPKDTVLYEERPLYIARMGKTLYYSSMSDSLSAAGLKPQEINGNCIYEYDSNAALIREVEVDRSNSSMEYSPKVTAPATIVKSMTNGTSGKNSGASTTKDLILSEELPTDFFQKGGRGHGGKVYFFRGRYWRNGHLVGKNSFISLPVTEDGEVVYNVEYSGEDYWEKTIINEKGEKVVEDGLVLDFYHGNLFKSYVDMHAFKLKYCDSTGKMVKADINIDTFFKNPIRLDRLSEFLPTNACFPHIKGYWNVGRNPEFPLQFREYQFDGEICREIAEITPVQYTPPIMGNAEREQLELEFDNAMDNKKTYSIEDDEEEFSFEKDLQEVADSLEIFLDFHGADELTSSQELIMEGIRDLYNTIKVLEDAEN